MGEVLSQSEIDNLLQALSTGELDVEQIQESGDRKVKDYDFKRPAKFSKEHNPRIFSNFSGKLFPN